MDKETILIVDDEKEIRELIEIYLKNEGYEVIMASTGLEAIKLVKKKKVDLVILDIMMPVVNGIDACIKIREQHNIPIIRIPYLVRDIKLEDLLLETSKYIV